MDVGAASRLPGLAVYSAAADADGVLTREAYRTLGVRQSIFPADARDRPQVEALARIGNPTALSDDWPGR